MRRKSSAGWPLTRTRAATIAHLTVTHGCGLVVGPAGTWKGLRSEAELPARAEIYLGVDIALRHDTSAVAWAHRLADGRIVLRCQSWSANPQAKAHQLVGGGELRLELVEAFIGELSRRVGRLRAIDRADSHAPATSLRLLHRRSR